MKSLYRMVVLMSLTMLALSIVQAKPTGFSLNTGVSLSFTPGTVFPIGGTATAVIAIQGGHCEQSGAGKVTITGTGGPVGVTIPSATANLPNGGTISVTMPNQPGIYTYTAKVNIHQGTDPNDHSTHTDVSSTSVTLTVYTVTDFSISGATGITGSSPEIFVVGYDPCTDPNTADDYVVLTAVTDPVVSQADVTLGWSGGEAISPADSLKRRVKRNQAALTDISISGPGLISVPVHRIAVVKVNLDISGVSDSEEDTVGATIYPNTDDDNNSANPNATPPFDGNDLNETPVTGENDLISISLSIEPAGVLGTVQLDMNSALKLAVYRNSDKSGNLPGGYTWNLASETLPTSLYIEGRDVSANTSDQVITLKFSWCIDLTDTVKATVEARDGSSTASLNIHNVVKVGSTETIGDITSGNIGGRKFLVMRVDIGAGEKLSSTGVAKVTIQENTTVHDTTNAKIEKSFDLSSSTGWERGYVVNNTIVWKPAAYAPNSIDAENKKGSIALLFRKGQIWSTATEPYAGDPNYEYPRSHNEDHSIQLAKIGDANASALSFQQYVVPTGWQIPYTSGPSTLSKELKNVIITQSSVQTNATIDYIKYDPDGGSNLSDPVVSFSFEDADPHSYSCVVYLRQTGHGDWSTSDPYLYKELSAPGNVSLRWSENLCALVDQPIWGTYTFDIYIREYDDVSSPSQPLLDTDSLKTPYCLWFEQHDVWYEDTEDETETELRYSYTLHDQGNHDPLELIAIPVDGTLTEQTAVEQGGTAVGEPYGGDTGLLGASIEENPISAPWRIIFVGEDACGAGTRRDHLANRMLAENKAPLKALCLFHPSTEHTDHYVKDKYPLSNRSTMLRAAVLSDNPKGWHTHSAYTQVDPDCWWGPVPGSTTAAWPGGAISFSWWKVQPDITESYERASDVIYTESTAGYTGWGPTQTFPVGTSRYRIGVLYGEKTTSSPKNDKALRMSVRDASLTNGIAQWASSWINVPFIMGSLQTEVENYLGTDCADLLVAAHNKAHTDQIQFAASYADNLAKNNTLTYPVALGDEQEGDLIFWDYHGTTEGRTPPDGTYDHSMIRINATNGIWASAGWNSTTDPFTKTRCVIIDSYVEWEQNMLDTWTIDPNEEKTLRDAAYNSVPYRVRRFK